jgi:hypothetical protein
MLTIRKEQMEIFSQKMLERFADQAAKNLKSNFDALTNKIPEPELHAMVHVKTIPAGFL